MSKIDSSDYIRARRAKSGTSYYGDPVVLKDNSRSKVTFVPFFIPHSDHQELAGKIVTWRKQKVGPKLIEEKSVSLSGQETLSLLKALKAHLAISESPEVEGDYILIKVSGQTIETELGGHDPKTVAAAITNVLGQPEIVAHLRDAELSSELCDAFRSAIRVREIETAVEKLRTMLSEGEVAENAYQRWCDDHFWALGPAKRITDITRSISISDQVDKLLPDISSGLSDIVELKRPDMDVLKYDGSHRNYYFSSDTSKAIGQCHRYLDVLHEAAAQGLRDHPEIVAYHPRATIIIGRSLDWNDEKTRCLHGLNQRLRSIKVMTYDHLLAQSEAILDVVLPSSEINLDDSCQLASDFEEEIPF
ncbi:DUF4263 domain-containing protein [Thalassovita mediterranea]|nr:DUF4263 domain-containing protein [Thalassovita mediterranea]